MKVARKYRLGLAIIATAALTPCCSWIGSHPVVANPPLPPGPAPKPQLQPQLQPQPPAPQPAPPTPEPPSPTPGSRSFPVAKPVPGKDGFVLSPYNNHLIDVKDFKSGTLVSDPRFQLSERKFFRVP